MLEPPRYLVHLFVAAKAGCHLYHFLIFVLNALVSHRHTLDPFGQCETPFARRSDSLIARQSVKRRLQRNEMNCRRHTSKGKEDEK